MAIREGRWDCKQCGTVGILGRHKICPNCGHPRPEKVRFYLPQDAPAVEDKALLKVAKAGPDWICEYCGASNRADKKSCKQCHAPRGESQSQEVKEYPLDAVPRRGDEGGDSGQSGARGLPPHEDHQEQQDQDQDQDASWEREPRSRPTSSPSRTSRATSRARTTSRSVPRRIGTSILLMGLLLLCLFGTWFLFRSSDVDATVTGFSWERTIQVEELRTLIENDWQIPANGRYLSQKEAIHHYQQVFVRNETRTRQVSERVQVGTRRYVCGQRDLGNGFFKDVECQKPIYETRTRTETYQEPIYRDVPVYRTKYTYEIDRWVNGRLERASGHDQTPQWPPINLKPKEREGQKRQQYTVEFTDPDRQTYQIDMPLQQWNTFSLRETHTLQVNRLGNASLKE